MTAPNPPDQTSSSTLPGTPPPAPAPAAEYRFGADAEPWMQGKTPAEVNVLARQLAEMAQRAVTQPYQAPQPTAPQSYQPPAADDYVTGAHIQQAGQQFLQQAQSYANPAIEMAASANLEMVKNQYGKEFGKYGPEIYNMLARVPKTDWSIDNLKRVVKLALVDHIDDLANERAAQISAQDPALRSSGANGSTSPSTQALDQGLTDAQKERLRRQGITESVVAEFAAKKGLTPQKWYETAGKHLIGEGV